MEEIQSEAREAFITTVEDMANSIIVLQSKKIRSLLRCIAYYDELRTVVDRARAGFDFNTVASEALVRTQSGWTFKMPSQNKNAIALVLALFIEVDTGKLDFVDIVSQFFPSRDVAKSFSTFCEVVIKPFKFAFLTMLDELGLENPEQVAQREREIDFVSGGLAKQTAYYVAKMREAVKLSKQSDETKLELICMLDGLDSALMACDSLMIKAVWLGVSFRLKAYNLCEREIQEVQKLIKMFLLTDKS